MSDQPTTTPETYTRIYNIFESPVAKYDCGKKCGALNGGTPICCDADYAVPVLQTQELKCLKGRSDMWRPTRPRDAAGKAIADDLADDYTTAACKGAKLCERENRALACRAFPFFPYITRQKEFIGLSYYWDYESTCWVISNLRIVEKDFIDEFVRVFEILFAEDEGEFVSFRDHSATMRRVFSRRNRPIPLIGRDGRFRKVLPHGAGIVDAEAAEFPAHGPYVSAEVYAEAVAEAGGTLPDEPVAPAVPATPGIVAAP